jgi:hypothetical protein
MSRVVTRSFRKQFKQVRHQPISDLAQKQDEQVQLMGDEHVNAPNMDATQRETNVAQRE